MANLQQIFRPHQFQANQGHLDLYHVYDNLSQTPYQQGIGIECGDLDRYFMNAGHVITPVAMRRHLNWANREHTQFISFYSDRADAIRERNRRRGQTNVPKGEHRDASSVRVAHVRITPNSNIWAFSRNEMLAMMSSFGMPVFDIMASSHPNEWFVWGDVPDQLVQQII